MTRTLTLTIVALGALAAAHGCSTPIGGGDSESHFLGTCVTTCASGLECLCGVCTRRCSAASDCSGLAGAECADTAGTACTKAKQICDVACLTNAACNTLGAGYECADGRCRPIAASSDGGPRSTADAATRDATGTGGAGAGGAPGNGGGSGGDACQHVTYPPPPTGATDGNYVEFVVAQSSVDLGDSPPDVQNPPTRYRTVGFDLDHLCTLSPITPGACNRTSSQVPILDGPGGVDNSFGAFVQLMRDRLGAQFNSDLLTAGLVGGAASNLLLHVTGYNGLADDDQVRVEWLASASFDALSATKGIKPKWDGTDVWPVRSDVVLGTRDKPKFFDDYAYVTKNKLVASLTDAAFPMVWGLTPTANVNLDIPFHAAFVVCDLASTTVGSWGATATNCTFGARVGQDDVVHQLSHFPDPLALPTVHPLCTDSAAYNVVKEGVCSIADMVGLSTAAALCDELSFGMRFETKPALLGNVYTVNPVGELCPPGSEPSSDSCATPHP